MCIVLYHHCPGCYGKKNNPHRVEFCPRKLMMKNGWIPGRKPRRFDEKPCTKALHYQEDHWGMETYESHKHIPGLKGRVPPEKFSGRMADLHLVPRNHCHRNEQEDSEEREPTREEWIQCLVNIAFPAGFSSSQPEHPSGQLREEILFPPSRMSNPKGLITPPSDSDGFNPQIPSDLEPWPESLVPTEGVYEPRTVIVIQDSDDNESESEISELASTPGSPPISPPPSPPPPPSPLMPPASPTPPVTKKRRYTKTLSRGKKMLTKSIENAKKACETSSKRIVKGKVKR